MSTPSSPSVRPPTDLPAPRVGRRACLSLPLLGLAACSGLPSRPDAPGESSRPPLGAPPAERSLASEQRRLSEALRGTPVVVETDRDGRLRVLVPLEFSFDRRRSAVRPALAAVLDRVAPALRESPRFAVRIQAPPDEGGGGGSNLAQDRAGAVRDYLVGKGVPRPRMSQIGRTDEPHVELLLSDRAG
jgi:outer membrane protein OmpA-like peptidoglycan-associated protein